MSIIGTAPFGFGMVLVFLSIMNYLIDSYVIFAASVLAANAVLRSLFGAAFPLFTPYMYNNIGIHWASAVPAFLALGCVPFPFLFYKFGPAIRARCKYAAEAQAFLDRIRAQGAPAQDAADEAESSSTVVGDEEPAAAAATRTPSHTRAREAELEAEALDYSYGDEAGQPAFAAIRPSGGDVHPLRQTSTHRSTAASIASVRNGVYEANPFDIDRVNTHESFGAKKSRSRASSVAKK